MSTPTLRERLKSCQLTVFKAVELPYIPAPARDGMAEIMLLLGELVDHVDKLERGSDGNANASRHDAVPGVRPGNTD